MVLRKRKASTGKKSKYNNRTKVVDGITFDSVNEARYYVLLKEQKACGEIADFTLQPKYILQPSFKKYAKTIRSISYTADFLVTYNDGSQEVIDVKGMQTQQGRLRVKMFDYKHPELTLKLVTYVYGKWWEFDEYEKEKKRRKGAKK
jgi:hypothetical protein